MKKDFNFRSAIVCVLVLIMCLTAFVACDKDKDGQDDLSGLGKAKDYVKQLYINNNEETAADYTVVSKVNIAGTIYNVSWTVAITTEGADADSVKVVAGESNVTIDVIDMAESEIKYVLTATITDAKGNTETVSFNRKVPKFHVATWKEYAEAKDGKLLVVDGIVTMFNSKKDGASYNNMYIQDNDGAYYAYSMDEDPKDKNIAVGMKVRLTGTKKNYNGTYELEKVLIKEVLDTNVQEVAPININELLANATSVKDKKLTNLQGSIVTLTDAILVEVDDSQKYCYFTVGGIKTYIRPSASAGFLSSKEITAFMKAFKEKIGYTATITGQALVYNNAFYMQPISKDAVEYGAVANLTPAEQVKFVKDNANALSDVTYSGYFVTLPGASDIFTDVKIAWTVDNTEICKIENGVATFTYDDTKEGGKVKLTATYTHATDTTVAPLQNEYTLKLLAPQEATVEQFLTKDEDGKVYIITGYIGASSATADEEGSFVVIDETGAAFSYNKVVGLALGDYVTVYGTREENFSFPQVGTVHVEKLEGGTYVEPTAEEIAVADVKVDGTDLYIGKFYQIVGGTIAVDGNYINLMNGTTKVASLYTNTTDAETYKALAGKEVIVYGYSRGVNTKDSYWQVQVARMVEVNDALKVERAAAALELASTTFGTGEVTLQATGLYDSKITWKSDNAAIAIAADGVTATIVAGTTDTSVKLTATIAIGETSTTKEFNVTVTATTPEYTVTFANVTGATVDVQVDGVAIATGAKVEQGKTLTISVTVDTENYVLVAVKAGATTLEAAEGKYSHQVVADVEITVEVKPNKGLSPEKAYSVVEIIEATKDLTSNEVTSDILYLKGVVKSFTAGSFVQNLVLEDGNDSTKTFLVYSANYGTTEGSVKSIYVGDTVVVCGYVKNYSGTIKMATANNTYVQFVSRTAGQGSIVIGETGNATVTVDNGQTTGDNGTTFTFEVAVTTGYEIVAVRVNGNKVEAVEGKYTGTIAGVTTITVETKAEGEVVAESETLAVAGSTGTLSGKTITWTATNFTVTGRQASSTTAIRTENSDHYRVYQKAELEIAGNNGKKITKVIVTCTSGDYAKVLQGSLKTTGATATVNASVVTVTVNEGSLDSILFTATAQTRISKVEVYTL